MPAGRIYKYKPKRRTMRKKRKTKATKALSIVKKIYRMKERKFIDTTELDIPIIQEGNVYTLNVTAPGNSDQAERIGDKISMTSLWWHLEFTPGPEQSEIVALKMIIFVDKTNSLDENNLLIPATPSVIQPFKPYSVDRRHNFTVLYEYNTIIGYADDEDTSSITNAKDRARVIKGSRSLKNMLTQYINGGNDADSITTNAIKVAFYSQEPEVNVNSAPRVSGAFRIRYTDS